VSDPAQAGILWPAMPEGPGTLLSVLGALRRNGLLAFPRRCLHEPVVVYRLAGAAVALASGPDAVRAVLRDQPGCFPRMPAGRRILGPIAGDGLLTSDGERWHQQRRVMAPAFTPRGLPVLIPPILRCTEAWLTRLSAQRGAAFDLLAELQRLSLEIAAVAMFSLDSAAFWADLRGMVTGYMADCGRPAVADFVLPGWVPTWRDARRARFRRRWTALIGGIVTRRIAMPAAAEAPRDLFDMMHAAHGADDPALLADQVATMIVAGHETTALALFWACLMLAASPALWGALAAEAADVDLSAADALARLPRARAVVQETLRLFPPAFLTARQASRAITVCGTQIPRGANVLIPIWLLHRHPALWAQPDLFDPRRWLDDAPEPDRACYIPFGLGPHVCIGAQLAMAEATLALAALTRRVRLTRTDTAAINPYGVLSLRPDRTVMMRAEV
jgi:cytochrome P450